MEAYQISFLLYDEKTLSWKSHKETFFSNKKNDEKNVELTWCEKYKDFFVKLENIRTI